MYVPTVPNHRGQPLQEDLLFFEPPPKEIGDLVSADSDMTSEEAYGDHYHTKLLLGLVAPPLLVFLLLWFTQPPGSNWVKVYLGSVICICVLSFPLLAFHLTRHGRNEFACSYVGRKGIAYFSIKRRGFKKVRDLIVLFKEAPELHVEESSVPRFNNLRSDETDDISYHLTWMDKWDKVIETYSDAIPHRHYREQHHGARFIRAMEKVWAEKPECHMSHSHRQITIIEDWLM